MVKAYDELADNDGCVVRAENETMVGARCTRYTAGGLDKKGIDIVLVSLVNVMT